MVVSVGVDFYSQFAALRPFQDAVICEDLA